MKWKDIPSDLVYIRFNNISSINWEGAPSGLKEINLEYNEITDIKWKNVPSSLVKINLSFNNISRINHLWWSCPNGVRFKDEVKELQESGYFIEL